MKYSLFVLLAFLCTSSLNAATIAKSDTEKQENLSSQQEWQIYDLGTLQEYSEAYVIDFNDQDQALVAGKKRPSLNRKQDEDRYYWSYWDKNYGLIPIESNESSRSSLRWWQRVNGDGVVLGIQHLRNGKKPFRHQLRLLTWESSKGLKNYDLPFPASPDSQSAWIAQARSSSKIVVSCTEDEAFAKSHNAKVFSIEDGSVVDLTPKLKTEAKELGYDAGDWLIIAVNSNGVMLGRFDYYIKHPITGKQVPGGTRYFIHDEGGITLIDWPDGLWTSLESRAPNDKLHMTIDGEGRVLYSLHMPARDRKTWSWGQTWVWSKEEGAIDLSPAGIHLGMTPGGGGALALGLLDDGTFFWSVYNYTEFNGFAFESPDKLLLLDLDKNRQLPAQSTEGYPGMKIERDLLNGFWRLDCKLSFPSSSPKEDLPSAKAGQLYFNAEVFGEKHPFMIEHCSL